MFEGGTAGVTKAVEGDVSSTGLKSSHISWKYVRTKQLKYHASVESFETYVENRKDHAPTIHKIRNPQHKEITSISSFKQHALWTSISGASE
jgi:hypothetical protein